MFSRIREMGPAFAGLLVLATVVSGSVAAESLAGRDDLTREDAARVAAVTKPAADFSRAEDHERLSGGAGTALSRLDRAAFSHADGSMPEAQGQDFILGKALFKKLWVAAPSSTQASDGLGPLYNARSCLRCHAGNGRGRPPEGTGPIADSFFLRLSVPPLTASDHALLAGKSVLRLPEPTYGGQLQTLAVPGLQPEGRVAVSYTTEMIVMNGGETVALRRPDYSVTDLAYGPMRGDVMISPRIAPALVGMGLLEAVHDADILSQADPDDRNGDGISGRVSMVRDGVTRELVPGRFGWKASTATVRRQSADAFSGDIGISTPLAPDPHGDCTAAQTECRARQTGVQPRLGDTEAPDPILDLVAFYTASLAVPIRRDADAPDVLKGKALFYGAGCAACHRPKYVTSRNADIPHHRFQLIWPYTDLLLHDMGDALSDGRPVGDAEGSEWRTAPLWGIGLTGTVNGNSYFLHDGRARTLIEAILWHGGEAQAARDRVVAMSPDDRRYLIRFLESL